MEVNKTPTPGIDTTDYIKEFSISEETLSKIKDKFRKDKDF